MKNLNYLNEYRIPLYDDYGDEHNGVFMIPIDNKFFQVVASDGDDWDHVSITIKTQTGELVKRCPKWNEMCKIKEMFFEDDEEVMQFHPKKEDYVDVHPYCLHLWRPQKLKIPSPPSYMVGYTKKYTLNDK